MRLDHRALCVKHATPSQPQRRATRALRLTLPELVERAAQPRHLCCGRLPPCRGRRRVRPPRVRSRRWARSSADCACVTAVGGGVDRALGVAHGGVGALCVACRRVTDSLGRLEVALDASPLEREVRSPARRPPPSVGLRGRLLRAGSFAASWGLAGGVGASPARCRRIRTLASSPASPSSRPARSCSVDASDVAISASRSVISGSAAGRPWLCEHGVGAARQLARSIAQAGHRRAQVDAAASGDRAALRVPHQRRGVGEALDVGRRARRRSTLSAQSTHAGRRIAADLGRPARARPRP